MPPAHPIGGLRGNGAIDGGAWHPDFREREKCFVARVR